MLRGARLGLVLLAGGVALVAAYSVLVWYGIYENDTAGQVCGDGVPHRDFYFPPYTACGLPGHRVDITPAINEYVGASLFILAAVVMVAGAVLLIAERNYGFRRRLHVRSSAEREEGQVREPSPQRSGVEQVVVEDLRVATAIARSAVERGAESVRISKELHPSGTVRVMIVWPPGAGRLSAAGTGDDPSAL